MGRRCIFRFSLPSRLNYGDSVSFYSLDDLMSKSGALSHVPIIPAIPAQGALTVNTTRVQRRGVVGSDPIQTALKVGLVFIFGSSSAFIFIFLFAFVFHCLSPRGRCLLTSTEKRIGDGSRSWILSSSRDRKPGLFWGRLLTPTRLPLHYIYSVADTTSIQQQATETSYKAISGASRPSF